MKPFDRPMTTRALMLFAALLYVHGVNAADAGRTVAELFTSQGCSSCPPADAVAGRLRNNPAVIVLSIHVNYWDGPKWRDTFSSQSGTARQYQYSRGMGQSSVFTPQLILNGTQSFVGSAESAIQRAIMASRFTPPAQVSLTRQADGTILLTLAGSAKNADLWEFDYVQHSATQIRGGENGGHMLDTYNDVTHIRRLGAFTPGTVQLPALKPPADGLAILVQTPGLGPILGAGAYEKQ